MLKRIFNQDISVVINTKGAEIISIINCNNFCEYIWEGNEQMWNRHAPIFFPIIGKLKDFRYKYDKREFLMMQNGFVKDLDFEVILEKDDEICMVLESFPQTEEYFPFNFTMQVYYKLIGNSVISKINIINKDEKDMPFSIGVCPCFNCPLDKNYKFEDYYLEFENKENFRAIKNESGLMSTKEYNIKANGKNITLKHKLFSDDVITLKAITSQKVSLKTNLDTKKISIEFSKVPYLGLWSQDGKDSFIAIEPWDGVLDNIKANGFIEDKQGIVSLPPSKTYEFQYKITID